MQCTVLLQVYPPHQGKSSLTTICCLEASAERPVTPENIIISLSGQQQTFSPLKAHSDYSKSTDALIGSECSTFRSDNLSLTSMEVISFISALFQEWRDRRSQDWCKVLYLRFKNYTFSRDWVIKMSCERILGEKDDHFKLSVCCGVGPGGCQITDQHLLNWLSRIIKDKLPGQQQLSLSGQTS